MKNQFTDRKGFGIKRKLYAKCTLVKRINLAERQKEELHVAFSELTINLTRRSSN